MTHAVATERRLDEGTVAQRRAALFPYLGGRGFGPLAVMAAVSAGASTWPVVLLLRRDDLAVDLALKRSDVELWGAGILGVAAFAALLVGFVGSARVARIVVQISALGLAGLLGAMGAVNQAQPLRLMVVGLAVLSAPVWVLGRRIVLDITGPAGGWRAIAAPWLGTGFGVLAVMAPEFIADRQNWGYLLAGSGVVLFLAASLIPPARASDGHGGISHPSLTDPDPVTPLTPVLVAAFAVGIAALGMGPTALDRLAQRWAFDLPEVAGVVVSASLATVVGGLMAHWFTNVARRNSRSAGDVATVIATVLGLLMAIGAASETEVGIIAAWGCAAGAVILFAISSERSVLGGRSGAAGAAAASGLVVSFLVGGAVSMAAATRFNSISDAAIIALAALPTVVLCGPTALQVDRLARSRRHAAVAPSVGQSSQVATEFMMVEGRPRSLLVARNLDVSYDQVQVLFGAGICVEEGQLVALLGTNGAGKTTLLRTISGLVRQQRGSIHFAGVDVSEFDPTWRVTLGINQIAGGRAVAEGLTVADNLKLFGHSIGHQRARLHQGIEEALALFPRLNDRRNQMGSTLSGGEKQMLALSKALILRPRLLIIDEFSLGLAPRIVGELLPVVEQLNADGTAVLLVEQSVNIALSVASHAYCMEKGEIVFDGPASVLRDDPDLMRAVYLEGVGSAFAS